MDKKLTAFVARVNAALPRAAGASYARFAAMPVQAHEMPLMQAGVTYGVGPYDTACQLIDDRAETFRLFTQGEG